MSGSRMRTSKKILLTGIFILFVQFVSRSQPPNTLYFIENMPYRHTLNPSFQPTQDFYVSVPTLSYIHLNIGNNSLTLKNIFQNNTEGNTVYFLNPDGDKDYFYNTLQPVTLLNVDTKISLLGAGLRMYDSYFTLDISQRVSSQLYLPKDFFRFALYLTPDIDNNIFDFRHLDFSAQTYTDVSFGISYTFNRRLNFGGKLRLLVGNNNKSFSHSKFDVSANIEEWNISGNGELKSSGGDHLDVYENFDSIRYSSNGIKGFATIAGMGAGLDAGMSYRITKHLTFSTAITDVGAIRWKKNTTNTKYNLDYTFTGVNKSVNDNYSLEELLDSIKTAFINSQEVSNNAGKRYTTTLLPKLYIGLQQDFFDKRLSLGLLSKTLLNSQKTYGELTFSVNGKPLEWLNISLSHSFFNKSFSTFGAGIGIQTGSLYWFTALDYIAFDNVPLPIKKIDSSLPDITLGAPYNSKAFDIAMGVVIALDDLNWFKSKKIDPFEAEEREIELSGFKNCRVR